ncbi:MAG: hypothetical protein V4561_02970 [Bacteroidota bacterium]
MQLVIQYISMFSALVPIVFYFIYNSRFESSRWLLYYLLVSFCFEVLFLAIEKEKLSIDHHYLIHSFFVLEFCLISIYFFRQHIISKKLQSAISVVALLAYFLLLSDKDLFRFNTIGCALFSLVLIFYCIMGFKQLSQRALPIYLEKTAFFWVICGLLLFFSGSFFVYVFKAYLAASDVTLYKQLWHYVHDVLIILKCTFIAISFTRKIEK